MKLINYNYGYYDKFSCSIHGKIVLSSRSWRKLIKELRDRRRTKAISYFYGDIFEEDIKRYYQTKQGRLYNIRVAAANYLVNKYHLKGYKQANYMILVRP